MGFKGFKGSGFRVQGSRFKVQGSGFRVQGSKKPVNLWNLQNPLNL